MAHATPAPTTALLKLAAKTRPATLKAAREALKAAGMRQVLAAEMLVVTEGLYKARDSAAKGRRARKLGYCPVDPWGKRFNYSPYKGIVERIIVGTPGRAPVRLPAGTPAERLQAVREAAISGTYTRIYRTAAHGNLSVHLTDDPACVGIAQLESFLDPHRGAKWLVRVQDTRITVPTMWRTRVQRHGLAVVDGMMTLDAAPIEAHGCELYAATWLVQGRGTTTTAARGYIARADGATYHAATIDQALTGLAKKRRELQLVARLANADVMAKLAADHGTARVTLGDARAVGACEYGIRSWCNAVGIEYEAGVTTLGTVLQGYQREPRPEARAVIIRVLRRQRAMA